MDRASVTYVTGGIVDIRSAAVLRILLGLFVIAHALVHLAVWVPPPGGSTPIQTARSWLFGDVRPLAVGLRRRRSRPAAAGGIALLAGAGWWPWVVIAGSAVSILLIALTFTPCHSADVRTVVALRARHRRSAAGVGCAHAALKGSRPAPVPLCFGGPEVMEIVDLPDPTPGPGQQLYEVSSAGVNYADTHHQVSVD